jgi:phenylacetate-coenzyme A ligase PaaK-like adenylate-forming protein
VHKWAAEKTGLYENLTPVSLRRWQLEKLKVQLNYARERCRHYKEILPETAELEKLPFTTIDDIANDPYAFLAIAQSKVARITTLPVPGISDSKKRVFFSKKDLEKVVEFFAVGMSIMVEKGDRVQILISSDSQYSLGSLLKESLYRIGAASEISGSINSVYDALEASKNADCVVGMPAELLYMSKVESNLRPKSILLTADYVPDTIIESIKNTWKCRVFTHYGHTELGFGFAVDCSCHSGLHTRDADFIVEIISPITGNPVIPGEPGEIVLTSLSNEAMPLIRYRTGEISRLEDKPCGCGSNLHRLKKFEGRYDNSIIFPGGRSLSIHQLDELLFAEPSLRGFNAVLKSNNILHLIIDSSDKIDADKLAAVLPEEVKPEIEYGAVPPFRKRNKRRIIIE